MSGPYLTGRAPLPEEHVPYLTGSESPPKGTGPDEVWSKKSVDENGNHEEEWFTGRNFGRVDGPSRITHYTQGGWVEEWPVSRWGAGRHSRIGGPALVRYRADGSVDHELWAVNGRKHRMDGFAETYYHLDGTVGIRSWWLDGFEYLHRVMFVGEIRRGWSGERRITEVVRSSFAPLLDDFSADEIIDAYVLGVNTIDGIRAVLEGSPIEWALAFEEGGACV